MLEGLNAKSSHSNKESIDLSVGGEDREDTRKAQMDARNRYACYLWRSDAGILEMGYNESDAASEVS